MTAPVAAPADDAGSVLDELPGFRAIPDEVRRLVADACELVSYDFGSAIVREGDDADAFYVLVSGTARVVERAGSADEVPLSLLHRGDSFGEMGLLNESTRVATVATSGPVRALRLDRSVFRALTRRQPEVREQFERLARIRSIQNLLRLFSTFRTLRDGDDRAARGGARAGRGRRARARDPRTRGARAPVPGRGRPAADLRGAGWEAGRHRVPARGRCVRRGLRAANGAALGNRRGADAVPPARPAGRPPDGTARRAARLPRPARRACGASRLPPGRPRPAGLRRGDPPRRGGGARSRRPGPGDGGRRRRGGGGGVHGRRRRSTSAARTAAASARPPARRDGLRRRLPRHGHALLRQDRLAAADPGARPHLDRRDEPARDRARGRGARPGLHARCACPRAGSTCCRCRPSCTGRETTGSCSTRSGRPGAGRRPGQRYPQAVARGVRGEVDWLRGVFEPTAAFEDTPEARPRNSWACRSSRRAGARSSRPRCSRWSRRASSS